MRSLYRIGHSITMLPVIASMAGFLISTSAPALAQNLAPPGARVLPAINLSPDVPASATAEPLLLSTTRLQALVDGVRERLSISQEVVVSIVAEDKLLVSVERMPSRDGAFALAFERDFLAVLTEDELTAVVAHELGHVWIFTHHPYLQTEELANKVALKLVSRDTLAKVYEKVWQRTGGKGELAYLPPADAPAH